MNAFQSYNKQPYLQVSTASAMCAFVMGYVGNTQCTLPEAVSVEAYN